MRKIERQMIEAIRAGKDWHKANTCTRIFDDGTCLVYLHNSIIARIVPVDPIYQVSPGWITLAGWNTPTTRSRVTAIAREFSAQCIGISTRKGQAYAHYTTDRANYTQRAVADDELVAL